MQRINVPDEMNRVYSNYKQGAAARATLSLVNKQRTVILLHVDATQEEKHGENLQQLNQDVHFKHK